MAIAERTAESDAGRKVLRHAVDTGQVKISDLAYSRDLGVVLEAGTDPRDTTELFAGFRVDLQFGAPGALVKRYNIARLTPLPSSEAPSFLFLGVLGDAGEERAMFLNPAEAAPSGDVVCTPSPEDCSRFEVAPGHSGLFDVPNLDGTTFEYQLDVEAITPLEADSPEEASAMRLRESPAGRVILRRLITEVGGLVADLNYSPAQGKLVPTSAK
jgi:hypothetical protein